MSRYDDIDPSNIDPATGRPYSNYSSPSLDTSFHDGEMAGDEDWEAEGRRIALEGMGLSDGAYLAMADELGLDPCEYDEDEDDDSCSSPSGHSWVVRDDNEEISYCEWCGADGNA